MKYTHLIAFAGLVGAGLILIGAASVSAATSSPYALQQAMSVDDHFSLIDPQNGDGFTLSSGFFSGRASGTSPTASGYTFDKTAELEHDQRVYALLIDGRYDFNYDFGSALPVHPYVNGGLGMAMYGDNAAGNNSLQGGDVVPLFRIGGGVTYRLGSEWNLSLDYRAGFAGASANDQIFTGRGGQQAIDLHTLNMGMHYRF